MTKQPRSTDDVLWPGSAFARLRDLLKDLKPGTDPLDLAIGEPQFAPPSFVAEVMGAGDADYRPYPPVNGTDEFRKAVHAWLARRYEGSDALIDPDTQIMPVCGTREALFLVAQVAIPPTPSPDPRPVVLIPNPFYQPYGAAAVAVRAEVIYVPAPAENNFLPDFTGLPEETLSRTRLVYLCTPVNPQGSVASFDYLSNLLQAARQYDFTLVVDECYAEIYDTDPPPGALDAAIQSGSLDNLLIFHSLSKRSNLAGLRSGFCAGDIKLMQRFRSLRLLGSPQMPLPALSASARVWADETCPQENRERYRANLDCAERIIGNRFGFYRPSGGFFLWLDVGDGEHAARTLWTQAGVRVLPGRYLSQDDPTVSGGNPGASYIRVALVHDEKTTAEALTRLAQTL
ncbi:MAG: aminotransferase class I/II-fold pyridoxal phosphate-dependent enzyme [Parvularculales bacterium]